MKKLLLIPFVLVTVYCGGWYYIAKELNNGIHQFYETDGPLLGYQFYGDKPKLSGFPFKPVVTYKKGFAKDGVNFEFDTIKIKAYPLPTQPLSANIKNLSIQVAKSKRRYDMDQLKTTIIIPKFMPEDVTRPNIITWQKDVGQIDITYLELNKDTITAQASGAIGLDDNLQPSIDMNTLLKDYDKLLEILSEETKEITPLQSKIALTIFNGIGKKDEESGRKYVELRIRIKDRRLIIGPLKTIKFPAVSWPE